MTSATDTITDDRKIVVTERAATEFMHIVAQKALPEGTGMRLSVKGGGCSGFEYALALDKPKEDDHLFEDGGVSVVVDRASMQFVFGSEVDYVEGLQGAGFAVNNPNVVAACGCGSSFQVREDAAKQAATV